jgi:hypothetical protein
VRLRTIRFQPRVDSSISCTTGTLSTLIRPGLLPVTPRKVFQNIKKAAETCNIMDTVLHPQASLLGLPVELRLAIYHQLANTLHIHHMFHVDGRSHHCSTTFQQWPCSFPDPQFPQLCTRPRFSGLHPTRELCKHQSDSVDAFAIRRTCRLIHAEMRGIYEPNGVTSATSLSAVAGSLYESFYKLRRARIQQLRCITLQETPYNIVQMQNTIYHLEKWARCMVSLHTVAVQSPIAHSRFNDKRRPQGRYFSPETTWQNLGIVQKLDSIFEARVTIVLDAWICFKPSHNLYEGSGASEEMLIVRGVLWQGVEPRRTSFWTTRNEVVEGNVESGLSLGSESLGQAEWREHWMGKKLAFGQK